jgi:TRAP-type mannitol/chloroaromatic compound transport system permease large subunit
MIVTPNALSPREAPYSDDQATQVLPRATAGQQAPGMLAPFLLLMIPTLVLALVVGAVVAQPLAPAAGAAIGVVGAAAGLWLAVRRANRHTR